MTVAAFRQCGINGCEEPSAFRVFAAYHPVNAPWEAHPRLARYPMPMARPCPEHLQAFIEADQLLGVGPSGYYIEPVSAPRPDGPAGVAGERQDEPDEEQGQRESGESPRDLRNDEVDQSDDRRGHDEEKRNGVHETEVPDGTD